MDIEPKTPELAAQQDQVLEYVASMIEGLVTLLRSTGLNDQADRLSQVEM